MDLIRKQLDELMPNRNGEDEQDQRQARHYSDSNVCPYFLMGLCPYDLFVNTKVDMGYCSKIHSDKHKAQFDKDCERNDRLVQEYEVILERELDRIVGECDRKIQRANRRLEETRPDDKPEDENPEVSKLDEEISQALKESEQLGEEGKIDESMKVMEKVEELRRKKLQLQTQNNVNVSSNQQKLRVCEVCAAYLSIQDSDQRLADHFGGKLHQGFNIVRQKIQEIKDNQAKRREKDRDRNDYHRRDREKERDRRYRDDERDRDRDRDRDRKYRSSRDGRRDRSPDRSRRDKDRSRERSRSPDRSRRHRH